MSFADDLVAAFAPWSSPHLDDYLRTLGEMFEESEWYVSDTEEGEDGWTVIFDPDRTLNKDLRWLGQVVGESIPVNHPEGLAREWVRDRNNQNRGTVGAILRAAQRNLTGARSVVLYEKSSSLAAVGADVDALLVITYANQTPYPDKTARDLRAVVPGDIVLTYIVHYGQLWQDVKTNNATWAAVKSTYSSWDVVRVTNMPLSGGTSISRPVPAT